VAIDNTNVTKELRARYINPAKAAGYRIIGLFFQSVLADCLVRNEKREGKAKLKSVALFGMSAQLELPSINEGFDNLFFVRIYDGNFEIETWKDP
jgi:predicted kinase